MISPLKDADLDALAQKTRNNFPDIQKTPPPPVKQYSEYHNVSRGGALIKSSTSNPELMYKEFDFGAPFGPEGWWYNACRLTIQRYAPAGQKPSAEFFFDAVADSYGRYTNAWDYNIVLMDGATALRSILVGKSLIDCRTSTRIRLQSLIPNPTGFDSFPLPYYQSITAVRLEAGGNVESC